MELAIGDCTVELVQGDITRQEVDAIGNAANARLAGGGGVDGAIHRAGGPDIMKELDRRYPRGCPTGSAVITTAGRMSASYVIHAVGPIYEDGRQGEPELLASAYRSTLELAASHDCNSLALPAISAGVYGYPLAAAARIALATTIAFLRERGRPARVRFVLFNETILRAFETELKSLAAEL